MESSLSTLILISLIVGYVGAVIVIKIHNGIRTKQLSAILNAIFFLSLALFTISISPENVVFASIQQSILAAVFAALLLVVYLIRTLNRYLQRTKDPILKQILITRVLVIFALLGPILAIFINAEFAFILASLVLTASLISYVVQQRDLIDLGQPFILKEHLPVILLSASTALSLISIYIFDEPRNVYALPWYLTTFVLATQVLMDASKGKQKPVDASQEADATVDDLDQALADQNLELQLTLRELKEKNQQLEKLNTLDALSGIHNRRHFDKKIQAELRRTRRERLPLALVMFDIDHFKNVNDTYGHLVGDEVIRTVALTASETLQRSSDEAFRYGGEEYTLILPNTDKDGAYALAERIRKKIEQQTIPYSQGVVKCTASFGIGFTDSMAPMTPKEIISQADDALYEAKRSGRNQVCIYSSKEVLNGTP